MLDLLLAMGRGDEKRLVGRRRQVHAGVEQAVEDSGEARAVGLLESFRSGRTLAQGVLPAGWRVLVSKVCLRCRKNVSRWLNINWKAWSRLVTRSARC